MDAVDIVPLGKNEVLRIPFGTVVLWTFSPRDSGKDGASGSRKEAAATKGQLLVQWLLPKAPLSLAGKDGVLAEVRHGFGRLMASHGAKKPWEAIRGTLEGWLAAAGEAVPAGSVR